MFYSEIYCVEWDGEFYRSVFPKSEAELAQLHTTVQDALDYFAEVRPNVKVKVLNAYLKYSEKQLLTAASSLKSDEGENPEYDRALAELISYLTGKSVSKVVEQLQGVQP